MDQEQWLHAAKEVARLARQSTTHPAPYTDTLPVQWIRELLSFAPPYRANRPLPALDTLRSLDY